MEVEQKSGTLVFPTYIKDATMKLKKKMVLWGLEFA